MADLGVPRRILLATDLSARCDRALERAIDLASGWNAHLTILHVLQALHEADITVPEGSVPSWRRPPDPAAVAKQSIRLGLRADVGDAVEKASVRVEEGDAARMIEQVAEQEGSELVITGIAREDVFARHPVILGKTVDRLLRRSNVPILIVRNRPRAAYGHIVVATDFSDSSGHALQAALRLFPFQTLHLLHAFEPPYANLLSDRAQYEDQYRDGLKRELAGFLSTIFLPEQDRRRLESLIERGDPAQLLRQYVLDRNADLVVLGTHGRSAVFDVLVGSTAKSILATLPCDALVVRELRARPGSDR